MNILIVGCNGFIGTKLFTYFSGRKYNVTGCAIQKINADTFLLNADLSNLSEVFEVGNFDVCINASGSSTVNFSMLHEAKDYELNVLNVEKILEAIKLHQPDCKFINLSSAAVYGNPATLPIKETAATFPISPYGKHKLVSEQLLKKYAQQHKLNTLSLRVFSVYGNGLKKQLFWDIYQKTLQGSSIQLYGSGNETRDFIHSDDLMQAIELLMLNATFDGRPINVGSGNETTIRHAAQLMLNNLLPGYEIKFTGVQNNADPQHWKADITELNALGFIPETTLELGLKKYATWLSELN